MEKEKVSKKELSNRVNEALKKIIGIELDTDWTRPGKTDLKILSEVLEGIGDKKLEGYVSDRIRERIEKGLKIYRGLRDELVGAIEKKAMEKIEKWLEEK